LGNNPQFKYHELDQNQFELNSNNQITNLNNDATYTGNEFNELEQQLSSRNNNE